MYAGVVNSMALYGATIWADAANRTPKIRDALRRLQRRVAIRVVRGNRTISHAAAAILAGLPPMELVARMYKEIYVQTRGLQSRGDNITARVKRILKVRARRHLIEEWKEYVNSIPETHSGERVVGAVRPILKEWMERTHGEVFPSCTGNVRAWMLRGIPVQDRTRANGAMLPLRGRYGHCATHVVSL